MTKQQFAQRLARSASAWVTAALVAGAGPAAAIDMASQPEPAAAITVAQAEPDAAGKRAASASAQSQPAGNAPAATARPADGQDAFQPYALALAGALLMAYIGLRRPQD